MSNAERVEIKEKMPKYVIEVPRYIAPSTIRALTRNAAHMKKTGAPAEDLQAALRVLNSLDAQFCGPDPNGRLGETYTAENIDSIILIGGA